MAASEEGLPFFTFFLDVLDVLDVRGTAFFRRVFDVAD